MAAKFKNIKDKFQKLIKRADYLPSLNFPSDFQQQHKLEKKKKKPVFS